MSNQTGLIDRTDRLSYKCLGVGAGAKVVVSPLYKGKRLRKTLEAVKLRPGQPSPIWLPVHIVEYTYWIVYA